MVNDSSEMCWVYVIEATGKSFSIGIAVDILLWIKEFGLISGGKGNGSRLIYCKQFSDTLSALGHKLLLEHLSPQSVMSIVKKENPGLLDLRSTIAI